MRQPSRVVVIIVKLFVSNEIVGSLYDHWAVTNTLVWNDLRGQSCYKLSNLRKLCQIARV